MSQVVELFDRIVREDDGQDMVEYGILLGVLAVAGIAIAVLLVPKVQAMWTAANTAIT